MLGHLPQEIIKYLVDELPPFTGVLMVKCDPLGNIVDFYGSYQEYFDDEPVIGKPLHDYSPALYSMIPPLVSPMVLNNIKSLTAVYADIHIVESSSDDYWVFFIDQTNEVDKIKDILQKINVQKFQSESKVRRNTKYAFFDVFGYLQLKVIGGNLAIVNSDTPDWFNSLGKNIEAGDKIIYTEVFPYLEVFDYEAVEFWEKNQNGKIKSGIWTETSTDGSEIPLNADAIWFEGEKYILIGKIDVSIDGAQTALQMARDQKLAYEKLEKAERKLKTLLEYKDKFVSIVSHDLRSPVAAVLGIAELLLNDESEMKKLNEFNQDMLSSIKEEMLRLLDYNDKLYHWSNLELGNFEIVKSDVSLQKIIETAQRTAQKKLDAKNISFSTNLKKDLEINVDMTLFLQVINNLMANAIKFTPENGKVKIDVHENADSKSIDVAVIDTGVGMPAEVAANIFQGFARNSTMGTSGEKGTGLGLGIVKKIIDAHGFTIRVDSHPGKGSSFIVSL
jgi:signal transduction histidine kinase